MDFGQARYAVHSSIKAYKMARVTNPSKQIDFAEVDDTYSYKELQHIEALGLAKHAGKFVSSGKGDPDGVLPVNVSGGLVWLGIFFGGSPVNKVYEAVFQVRGMSGKNQL